MLKMKVKNKGTKKGGYTIRQILPITVEEKKKMPEWQPIPNAYFADPNCNV